MPVAEELNLAFSAITALATMCLAVVAICALIAAQRQIATTKRIAALQMFIDAFKIEIEHPKFAGGASTPEKTSQLINDPSYQSYVSLVLTSCEEILSTSWGTPEYDGWRNSIKYNLKAQQYYFVEDDGLFNSSDWSEYYNEDLVQILREIAEEVNEDAKG